MRRMFPMILVLCVAAVAAFLFLFSRTIPVFDEMARQEVHEKERHEMRKALLETHPDLALTTVESLIKESWKIDQRTRGGEMRRKVAERARELRDRYRDETGNPYMGGIDSYHWLRHLKNLRANGHAGDRMQDGVEYDALASRPVDVSTRRNAHLYFAWPLAALADRTGLPLTSVLAFLPAVLFFAIAFSSFWCAKRIGATDLGAFFASFSITLSPFFFSRVCTEWFDTDIYSIIFPLLILALYLVSLDLRVGRGRRFAMAGLSAVVMAVYAATWQGWWFIFDIMIISNFLYFVNLKDISREEGRDTTELRAQVGMFGLFFGLSAVLISLLSGPGVFVHFISEPLRLSHVLGVTPDSIWPNVYLTVEELSPASVAFIVHSIGGSFIFFLGLMGLLVAFVRDRMLRNTVFGAGLLCVALWLVIPFYAAMQALRFMLLLIPPAGLAFGLVIGKIRDAAAAFSDRGDVPAWKRYGVRFGLLGLMVLYLFAHTTRIYATAYPTVPKIDDTWQRTLVRLERQTPPDSVINSWWDFGHWFKAVANRRVLFDGMTQNSPHAFWTARVLLSDNELAAARMLKMFDAQGHEGVDFLVEKMGSVEHAVRLTEQLMRLGPDEARGVLAGVLEPADVDTAMPLLFPAEAPPAFLVVSWDMLSKVAPISFIGNWDFVKVDLWLQSRKVSAAEFVTYAEERYDLSQEEISAIYLDVMSLRKKEAHLWFSKMVGYSSRLDRFNAWEGLWMFENGLVVDWETKRAYVMRPSTGTRGIPSALYYMEDGVFHEEPQSEATLDFSVLLMGKEQEVKSILLDPILAKSLLLRLYYLEGEGLEHFRLWSRETDENDNAICVYEIVWPD